MQVVYVKGVNDDIAQGLHFSEISQGITSDPGLLLGISASDVAQGLAAAVNGDPTGRFGATASGATVTITGPAFIASITDSETNITSSIDAGASTHAFAGGIPVTLTLTVPGNGLPTPGDVWKVTINGADFGYGVRQGDSLADVAANLASTISRGGLYDGHGHRHDDHDHAARQQPVHGQLEHRVVRERDARAVRLAATPPTWARLVLNVAASSDDRARRQLGDLAQRRPRRARAPSRTRTSPARTARHRCSRRSTSRSRTTTRRACSSSSRPVRRT